MRTLPQVAMLAALTAGLVQAGSVQAQQGGYPPQGGAPQRGGQPAPQQQPAPNNQNNSYGAPDPGNFDDFDDEIPF